MLFLDSRFLKFLIVGVANTVFGCSIMFVLYNVFDISYWASSVCNYVAGGILSFFLNKFFTFQNREKSVRQAVFFAVNVAVCYFVSYVLLKPLVFYAFSSFAEKIRGNIALCAGVVCYTLLNYIGQRLFVFAKKNNGGNSHAE